jgi:hypothetical protein
MRCCPAIFGNEVHKAKERPMKKTLLGLFAAVALFTFAKPLMAEEAPAGGEKPAETKKEKKGKKKKGGEEKPAEGGEKKE